MILQRVLASVEAAQPLLVVIAVALYAGSIPIAAWRWRILLRALGVDAALSRLVTIHLAAICVNNVTVRIGGEAARVVALAGDRSLVASSIVYERLSEVPAIAVLCAAALLLAGGEIRSGSASVRVILIAMAAVAIVGGAYVLPRALARWRRLSRFTVPPTTVLQACTASATVWGLDVMRLLTVAAAVGVAITPAQAAALSVITIVGGLAPTPGGLGVVDAAMVGGLIAFGVAPAEAAAVTAIERGISYGLATAAGAGALSMLGGRAVWSAMRRSVPEAA
jgi:uncharacterized membrane protein YbhN (UPF0104 family)